MYRRVLFVSVIVLVSLAAACGPSPAPATTASSGEQARPVTLEPATRLRFYAGCATGDLEDWLESNQFLAAEFAATLNRGAVLPPTEQDSTIARLQELRIGLSDIIAPNECAGEVHRLTGSMMDAALTAVQAYASGEIANLIPVVEQVNAVLAQLQTGQTDLLARLDGELQATQAALEN